MNCVICGARVINLNPKCNTCSPECTRAKHNGHTRDEQIALDIKWREQFELEQDRGFDRRITRDP